MAIQLSRKFFQGKDLFVGPHTYTFDPGHAGYEPDPTKLLSVRPIPSHILRGSKILVLLPTTNKQKIEALKAFFPPDSSAFIFEILEDIESGVGEQPYNRAGVDGATNRVIGALEWLCYGITHLGSQSHYCQDNNVGKIMVASIENFIHGPIVEISDKRTRKLSYLVDNPTKPVREIDEFRNPTIQNPKDYAFALLYDAVTGEYVTAQSRGVPIPLLKLGDDIIVDLVATAMDKGCIGYITNYGAQTVGKVIEALVEPTPGRVNTTDGKPYQISANWHADVTGGNPDRYSLLHEAAAKIRDMAIEKGMFDIVKKEE